MVTIVISDLHLHGAEGEGTTARKLAALSRHCSRLVLAGDVWDCCRWPWDRQPPAPAQFLSLAPQVLDVLREAAADGVEVVVLGGNHDLGLSQFDLDCAIYPDGMGGNRLPADPDARPRLLPAFCGGGIEAQHGHSGSLFCRTVVTDAAGPAHRPLGWYMTRVDAAGAYQGGRHMAGAVALSVRELAEIGFGGEPLGAGVVDALMAHAGATPEMAVIDENGMRLSWGTLRVLFRDLWQREVDRVGPVQAVQALHADLPGDAGLLPFMRRRAKQGESSVVVTGHTHQAGLWKGETATGAPCILANSGRFGADGGFDFAQIRHGAGAWEAALLDYTGDKPSLARRMVIVDGKWA